MKVLLDTHILLWWLADDRRLSKMARTVIADPANELFVSVVSLWELVIKTASGKLKVSLAEVSAVLKEGDYSVLPVHERHVLSLAGLPPHHADPFDRMLMAQALADSLRLLTQDRVLARYGAPVLPG